MDPQKLIELTRKRNEAVTAMEEINKRSIDESRELTDEEKALYERKKQEVDDIDSTLKREKELATLRKKPDGVTQTETDNQEDSEKRYSDFGTFVRDISEGNKANLRAMNITDSGSAGFLVPEQYEAGIVSLIGESGFIRSRAHVIPKGTQPDAKFKKAIRKQGAGGFNHGIEFEITGEKKKVTKESKLEFIELELDPLKCKPAGKIYLSQETIDNASSMQADIEQSFRSGIAEFEEDLFLNGTGVKQPLGLLNSKGAVSVGRKAAGSFAYVDFLKMKKQFHGKNPALVLSRDLFDVVGTFKDDGGQLIFKNGDITKDLPDTLGGVPILWTYSTVAAGEFGDVILCDFSYYYIKDGSGPYIKTNPYEMFDEDMVCIKITTHIDAQFIIPEPVTAKNGMQVSPLVILKKEAA